MSDDAVALRDEAALLRRSLDDARAEHARGELDDAALGAIERRDGARLAALSERLAAGRPLDAEPEVDSDVAQPPARRRSPRLLVTCAFALVLAAGTIGVVVGRPFASTPGVRHLNRVQTVAVLLVQAEQLIIMGQPARALTAYDAVLRLEPRNPEAFIESGWLRYEAGLRGHRPAEVDLGAAMLRRAIVLAPRNAASHLYDGIVLLQHDHQLRAARAQVLRSAELPESVPEENLTAEVLDYLAKH